MTLWAVVAVAAVGLAVPALRAPPSPDHDDQPVVPWPTTTNPDAEPAATAVTYDVDLGDQRHGYALRGRCTEGRDAVCERHLLVTEDGATWTPRPIQPWPSTTMLSGQVVALGGGRLVVSDERGPGPRLYSPDAGRTWREVPAVPRHRVDHIGGGVLQVRCADLGPDLDECHDRRLVVTLPESGHQAWLANPPVLDHAMPERHPADDGSWWVTGTDPSTRAWAIAVSRDGGHSWSVVRLPTEPGDTVKQVAVAGTGHHLYASATGPRPDVREPRSLVSIFRSTDGGQTWERTWRADGRAPRSLGGTPIVTADGGLFLAPDDVGPGYRSGDGGRTFTAVLDGPRVTDVRRTRAGYLATASGGAPGRYLTSADGRRWTPLTPPS